MAPREGGVARQPAGARGAPATAQPGRRPACAAREGRGLSPARPFVPPPARPAEAARPAPGPRPLLPPPWGRLRPSRKGPHAGGPAGRPGGPASPRRPPRRQEAAGARARPPAAGTQMAGDGRRTGTAAESSGAARRRLGGKQPAGQAQLTAVPGPSLPVPPTQMRGLAPVRGAAPV